MLMTRRRICMGRRGAIPSFDDDGCMWGRWSMRVWQGSKTRVGKTDDKSLKKLTKCVQAPSPSLNLLHPPEIWLTSCEKILEHFTQEKKQQRHAASLILAHLSSPSLSLGPTAADKALIFCRNMHPSTQILIELRLYENCNFVSPSSPNTTSSSKKNIRKSWKKRCKKYWEMGFKSCRRGKKYTQLCPYAHWALRRGIFASVYE